MSKQKYVERVVKLRNVRCSYPRVYDAEKFDENAKEAQFSCTFIMEKGSEAHLLVARAIKECIAEQWPQSKPQRLEHCLRDGSEKMSVGGEYPEGYSADVVFVNAKNTLRPSLYDAKGQPTTKADGLIYGGCYVAANIRLWAQHHQKWGPKVNASLDGIRFMRDGDAFGGGGRVAKPEDFADLDGDEYGDNVLDDDPLLG